MVITVIPRWLMQHFDISFTAPAGPVESAIVSLGAILFMCGATLAGWSVLTFFFHGDGTLAPWDPPKRFVIVGPYRHVRNPMITGVFFMLLSQTLVLRSPIHGLWAAFFVVLNVTFIPLVEEPQLRARFGPSFDDYCRHVHRFLPTRAPYTGQQISGVHSVAVVPASGRSSRFGSDKRKALIDGVPMLERVVATIRRAGIETVLVIDDNPDPDQGMFSTIRLGLERALACGADQVLVQPADMPFVSAATITRVVDECARTGRATCPRYTGKRGHPLVIPRALAERLLTVDPSTPLNEAFMTIGLVRHELDVDDPGILRDVDRPSDLA